MIGEIKTTYYVGVFLKNGTLSDKIGGFDTYKEAAEEMEFQKYFIPESEGYKYAIIEEKGRVLFER